MEVLKERSMLTSLSAPSVALASLVLGQTRQALDCNIGRGRH
jgi:hypothetical protein